MDEERQLVERAQKGDHRAFLTLLERYDRPVMSVVYRFTGRLEDREDLYQEIFLHCYRSLPRYRFRSSFLTWLYRLALNRALSQTRRGRGRERPGEAGPVEETADRLPAEGQPTPEDRIERRERSAALGRAMARLRGRQKICFHLHYVEEWETSRIAAVLDCSQGAVKSHLDRARRKIRAQQEVLQWRTSP
jgi:RNA polymerase sigma-70 factor (ECF subfamily)